MKTICFSLHFSRKKNNLHVIYTKTTCFGLSEKNYMSIFLKKYTKTICKLYVIVRKPYKNHTNRFHRVIYNNLRQFKIKTSNHFIH